MSSLTHAETEQLASLAAFEHGRREKHQIRRATPCASPARSCARRARHSVETRQRGFRLTTHCTSVKTVQSQRALDRAALNSAIGQVTDDDVARVATAKRSVVGRPTQEHLVRAWWDELCDLHTEQRQFLRVP